MKRITVLQLITAVAMFTLFSCSKDDTTTTTDKKVPTVTTTAISKITFTSAISGGSITSDGGSAITARGICWSKNPTPTVSDSKTADGSGSGNFTSILTGLSAGNTYYVRAYATNSEGTAYGSIVTVTTIGNIETVTDADGNVYHTITIQTQNWLGENLATTKYNDGNAIPLVTDITAWSGLSTPAYCWYNNDQSNKAIYGALYNWHTVNTAKLCPTGWHVATDAEWTTLTSNLGGGSVAGGKIKETDTVHWSGPNTGADNSSGFTALPGGLRLFVGTFGNIRTGGLWWSATEDNTDYAWGVNASSTDGQITRSYSNKHSGLSVRCVKN